MMIFIYLFIISLYSVCICILTKGIFNNDVHTERHTCRIITIYYNDTELPQWDLNPQPSAQYADALPIEPPMLDVRTRSQPVFRNHFIPKGCHSVWFGDAVKNLCTPQRCHLLCSLRYFQGFDQANYIMNATYLLVGWLFQYNFELKILQN